MDIVTDDAKKIDKKIEETTTEIPAVDEKTLVLTGKI